jgi:hypothetical protein
MDEGIAWFNRYTVVVALGVKRCGIVGHTHHFSVCSSEGSRVNRQAWRPVQMSMLIWRRAGLKASYLSGVLLTQQWHHSTWDYWQTHHVILLIIDFFGAYVNLQCLCGYIYTKFVVSVKYQCCWLMVSVIGSELHELLNKSLFTPRKQFQLWQALPFDLETLALFLLTM